MVVDKKMRFLRKNGEFVRQRKITAKQRDLFRKELDRLYPLVRGEW
jgi:hypothetical protein